MFIEMIVSYWLEVFLPQKEVFLQKDFRQTDEHLKS